MSFPYRLIGMVHLLPLPGAPLFHGSRQEIIDHALADARILEDAGFDALLVENYGDVPFRKDTNDLITVTEMTSIVSILRQHSRLPFGVQVLRNNPLAALSIAYSTGAEFIRVNVHTGVMATDQGIIEGRADETLRLRQSLKKDIAIMADAHVKHARPVGDFSIEDAARDAVHRGLADAVIVTGLATGCAPTVEEVVAVASAVPAPVFVGSGVTAESVASFLNHAAGVIAGTSIKAHGITINLVDPGRAQAFVKAAGIR